MLVSEEDVESALLIDRRDQLWAALARLDGRVQLNVKAVYDEDLEALVARLPEKHRQVLRLYHMEEKSYDEVARLLDFFDCFIP